ncbi:MAG: Ig-like domain-containing protein [Verrucomicrobiales bacterium]|nr:Ig-like domain-containing protein [Verrucomicrobiales bacterium]
MAGSKEWLAVVGIGLGGSAVLAQDFPITGISRDAGGTVTIEHRAQADAYYLLLRGAAVTAIRQPVDARLGQAGAVRLQDAASLSATGFYRVAEIPRDQPRDTDGDGIDDVWELERAPQLDPLDPLDAGLDPDGDGLTFLQEYERDHREATRIVRTSPSRNEAGVAVTRETILYFDRPLAADTVLTTTNLFASFGGRTLLARVELSSDRRKATLFYQENLPASARIRVTFDATDVRDEGGKEVDADGDGRPGGFANLDFDTLSIAALPTTAVIGRVFASEPLAGPVLSTNRPLGGVIITVDGAEETLRTTTDADGFFKLQPAPAGRFFVHVDGRTAVGSDWPGGAYYPFVGKAWEAVAGIETNLANGTGEIFLPLVPAAALQPVSPTEETRVTFAAETLNKFPELEGVEIRVPPNALFADDGTRGGRVGLAPVPPDRLPEPLPPGLNLPLVITIQTDGPMNFDRPVPVRFPNTPNPRTGLPLPPGAKSALWSFDHDTGEWDIVGPMTVSADGRFVETDPGVGVLQPGWHGQDPASRGEGDFAEYRSLPSNTGDIIWNAMNAGFGWTGVLFDIAAVVAAESPIGKFYSGLNLALDIGNFIVNPSWANAGKVTLSTIALAPGGTTVLRSAQVASTAWSAYSAADATSKLGDSIQSANNNFNPGPRRLHSDGRSRSAIRLANRAARFAAPPTYLAANYYRGPEQTAAMNAFLGHLDTLVAETDLQLPLYTTFAELTDLLIEEAQAAIAQGDTPWPAPRIREYADVAAQWRDARQTLRNRPFLLNVFTDAVREYGRFQQLYDLNSVLVAVETASGFGDPIRVFLSEFARRNPIRSRIHYRLTGPDGVQRGRLKAGEPLKLITRPHTPYRLDLLNAADLSIAIRLFASSPAGTRFDLAPILTRPIDQSPDTDGDGLSDLAEGIVGTRPDRADTDGDGVSDGAEVRADTNPLDNMPAITGVVGTLPLPGMAKDVCLDGNRALVALGSAGLAVVDVSRIESPTIIANVDTPGDARSVACDRTFVAVADGTAGLAIVDISDPPGAFIASQLNRLGDAHCVVAADGTAYVGTAAGEVIAVHLATGTVGNRLNLGAAIHDLVFYREHLLALTGNALHVIRLTDDAWVAISRQPVSLFAEGITARRRVSVSDRFAYVTSYPGYSVVDLSAPAAPVLIGNAVEHGPNSVKQILPTGSDLGVAAVGVNPRDDGTHDIWLYNLRDPNQRTNFTAQFPTPGIARAVALHRGLAFVADSASGLQTLNFLAADLGSTPPTIRLGATFALDPAVAESDTFSAVIAEVHDDVMVREVEFYLDGQPVFTDGNYPFEYRFRVPTLTETKTNFVLRARAFDTGGNATWSDAVTVMIAPDLTPPRARPAVPSSEGFAVSPTVISAIFNEPIAPDTLTPERLTLSYLGPDRTRGTDDDVPVVGTVGFVVESRLAELRFPAVTNAGRYEAVLLRGVTDLAGNATTNDVVWAFQVVVGTDTDGDGLTDDFELANAMDPTRADQNNNGIPDSLDDFDNDGLNNGEEMILGTNPRNPRTFNNVLDSQLDRDGDFLTDIRELALGTDWTRWDTDGDGWNDEIEIATGANPLRPNAYLPGIRSAPQTAYVLLPSGPQYRSAQSDVLRLGDGQAMQASGTADVLRYGGPDEYGHSIVSGVPPVRVRVFDPEAPEVAPNELPREGAVVIEAEDYNFGSGQHVAAASVMPYYGGAYSNRVGVLNVDYFNADAAGSQLYRPLPAPNNVNLFENLAGRYGAERPGWMVERNWRIGSAANVDWQLYTRSIPAGEYWVYAALSHNGQSAGQLRGSLELVTGDPTQPGAATVFLGDFAAPGTGGWGENSLVLLRSGGVPAVVMLTQPTTTFRFNLASGDLDWFVLVRVDSAP